MGLLDGKVAIVTGSGRGIGRGEALELAKQGAKVVVNDVGAEVTGEGVNEKIADVVVEIIQERGGEAVANYDNVSTWDGAGNLVAQAVDAFGQVDILVNNAGVIALNPLTAVSDAEWDVQHDVIVRGAFHCCRRVLPGMNARGWGRIVNVASVAGHRGIGTGVAYTSAKHALIGLTRALAMEVARQHITVNAVCPGTVPTDLLRGMGGTLAMDDAERLEAFTARHLSGRPIAPEDVAAAVLWLASDAAARVNGASLFVDDGWHAH